jgi:hypothetical protein
MQNGYATIYKGIMNIIVVNRERVRNYLPMNIPLGSSRAAESIEEKLFRALPLNQHRSRELIQQWI